MACAEFGRIRGQCKARVQPWHSVLARCKLPQYFGQTDARWTVDRPICEGLFEFQRRIRGLGCGEVMQNHPNLQNLLASLWSDIVVSAACNANPRFASRLYV